MEPWRCKLLSMQKFVWTVQTNSKNYNGNNSFIEGAIPVIMNRTSSGQQAIQKYIHIVRYHFCRGLNSNFFHIIIMRYSTLCCCSGVCLWTVSANNGIPSQRVVWSSTLPGTSQPEDDGQGGKRLKLFAMVIIYLWLQILLKFMVILGVKLHYVNRINFLLQLTTILPLSRALWRKSHLSYLSHFKM